MNSMPHGHIKESVMRKIAESEPHAIFFISDFSDLGSPETIRKLLTYATMEGLLEKVGQGIFVKPKDSRFGRIPVPAESVAQAIAERDRSEILPTGSTAANIIGLSTQVPMNLSYITTGSTRTVEVGNRRISFKHASPKNFACKGKAMCIIIQGLREVGEKELADSQYAAIKNFINKMDDPYLEEDLLLAPVWMQRIIKKLQNEI